MRTAHAVATVQVIRPRGRQPRRVSHTRHTGQDDAEAGDSSGVGRGRGRDSSADRAHVAEGRLLPRRREEIAVHISRFIVAMAGRRVVACVDLAAQPNRRRSAPSSSAMRCDLAAWGGGWWTSSPRARRPPASRRCARSRTWPDTSSRWGSRSCRTPGCPRRSRPTADPAHTSAPAGSMP